MAIENHHHHLPQYINLARCRSSPRPPWRSVPLPDTWPPLTASTPGRPPVPATPPYDNETAPLSLSPLSQSLSCLLSPFMPLLPSLHQSPSPPPPLLPPPPLHSEPPVAMVGGYPLSSQKDIHSRWTPDSIPPTLYNPMWLPSSSLGKAWMLSPWGGTRRYSATCSVMIRSRVTQAGGGMRLATALYHPFIW